VRLENSKNRIALVAVLACLCSCGRGFFAPDSREIASGYRLKRGANPNEFVLTIPHESGGMIIDEIGWREPLIVARASGSEYWDVINTARAEHNRVSDRQLKSDPAYQLIQITTADIAWNALNPSKRLW
jgi:hypothetical protein